MSEVSTPATAKNPWVSKGVVGGVLTVVLGAAMVFGVDSDPNAPGHVCDNAENLLDKVLQVAVVATGALATIGRITAKTPIKFPWQKD